MTTDRNWIRWIYIVSDPHAGARGFSLEGCEFRAKHPELVDDEMYSTVPGDRGTQRGKFWVISENELMRVCPDMQQFAQGRDWFFPAELCNGFLRPEGVIPVPTRDASPKEKQDAIDLFTGSQRKLLK